MIDPAVINLKKYTDMPKLKLALQNILTQAAPDGKVSQFTVSEFIAYLTPRLTTGISSGFVQVEDNVLPKPNNRASWSWVGLGTFTMDGATVLTTTSDLNFIFWNGSTWEVLQALNLTAPRPVFSNNIADASAGVKLIITTGIDGKQHLSNILDQYTGETITATETDDGVTVDNVIYFGYTGKKYKRDNVDKVKIKWFGAKCDGVTDDSVAVLQANNFAVANNLELYFHSATKIDTTTTITAKIKDCYHQIFTLSANIIIAGNNFVRPEWFGDVIYAGRKAVAVLPDYGGIVKLEKRRYKPFYPALPAVAVAEVNYLNKRGVIIQGSGAPTFGGLNAEYSYTRLENGTIIEGNFPVYAENFSIEHLGIDCGNETVMASLGGVAQEGFIHFKPNQSLALPNVSGFYANRISALCQDRSVPVHACIFEGIADGSAENIKVASAYHGIVIKSQNFNLNHFHASQNNGEGLIIKSDDYAVMSNVNVSNGNISGKLPLSEAFGVLIQAVGAAGGQVNISNITVSHKLTGVQVSNDGNIISDINLNNFIIDDCSKGYAILGATARINASNFVINNSDIGVLANSTSLDTKIVGLSITNAADAISGNGVLSADNVSFNNISGYLFNYTSINTRFFMGFYVANNLTGQIWPLNSGLINGWENFPGSNSQFKIGMQNGKIFINGLVVKTNATSDIIATISSQIRPAENKRFAALGFDSSTSSYLTVEVIIDTDGNISISNRDGYPTYISLDGISYDL